MKWNKLNILILFTVISIAILFTILWVVDFSGLGIPEMVPVLNSRTYGVFILLAFFVITFLLHRQLFKTILEIPLVFLIIAPFITTFISMLIYQTIRQIGILGNSLADKFSIIVLASIMPAVMITVFASSYALKIKKINGVWSQLAFILLVIGFLLIKKYGITHLEW